MTPKTHLPESFARALIEHAFPGFRVKELLAVGGMSDIYALSAGKFAMPSGRVAKVTAVQTIATMRGMEYYDESREMAVHEATLLKQLTGCRHIVHTFNSTFFRADGTPCSAQKCDVVVLLQEKLTPAKECLSKIILNESTLFQICCDITTALKALHQLGSVHRDIKLSNIMFRASDGVFVLCDLGACSRPGKTSGTLFVGGEHSTYAPELQDDRLLCGKPVPFCSDLYSLAQLTLMLAKQKNIPLSSPFSAMLEAETAEDYRRRKYKTAGEFLRALRSLPLPKPDMEIAPEVKTTVSSRHRLPAEAESPRSAAPPPSTVQAAAGLIGKGCAEEAEQLLAEQHDPALEPLRAYAALLQGKETARLKSRSPARKLLDLLIEMEKASRQGSSFAARPFLRLADTLPDGLLKGCCLFYAGRLSFYTSEPNARKNSVDLFIRAKANGFKAAGMSIAFASGVEVDEQAYIQQRRFYTALALSSP